MENLVIAQIQTRRDTGKVVSVTIFNPQLLQQLYNIQINDDITDDQIIEVMAATVNTMKGNRLDDLSKNIPLIKVLESIDDDKEEFVANVLFRQGILTFIKAILLEYRNYVETQELKSYFEIVSNLLTTLSNNSTEICKVIWSDYDLKMILEGILTDSESSTDIKHSCLMTMHNCLRRKEVIIKSFSSDEVKNYIVGMLQRRVNETTKLVVAIILSIVLREDETHILDHLEEEVKQLMQFLENEWISNIRSYRGYHIDETLEGLIGLFRSDRMKFFVISQPHFINLLKEVATSNNRYEEVKLTLECFQTLAQLDGAKQKLRDEYGMVGFMRELLKTCTFTDLIPRIRAFMIDCA